MCQLPGKVRPVPVVLVAGLLLLPPSPQHGLVLQVSLLHFFTWACIQNKEMLERVESMSRLFLTVFINTVLEDWGQIQWLVASWLLLYSFPGFSVHSLVSISIKSWLFLKNLRKSIPFREYRNVPMEWVDSLWVDLQKGRLGSYYGDFSPYYFEYRLWSLGDYGGKCVVSIQ